MTKLAISKTSLYLIPIYALIFFPEVSIATKLAIEKSSLYSIYLYKLAFLTISDVLVIILLLFVLVDFLKDLKVRLNLIFPYFLLFSLALIQGLLYNITIELNLKAFLYDLKASLYLFVPFMYLCRLKIDESYLTNFILMVVILSVLGAIYDAIYVGIYEEAEYSAYIGLPIVNSLAPFPLLLAGTLFIKRSKTTVTRFLFIGLSIFEILNVLNKVSLSSFYFILANLTMVGVYYCNLGKRMFLLVSVVLYYSLYLVVPALIIIFFQEILVVKSDGMTLRLAEMYNFLYNMNINYPILLGKGLGATWYEIVPLGLLDNYSAGPFQEGNVRFIWHNTVAGHFYKFGVLGSMIIVVLTCFIAMKLHQVRTSIMSDFVSYSLIAFAIININGIGVLKGAVYTSLVLFMATIILNKPEAN
jgi:hypothetical protein